MLWQEQLSFQAVENSLILPKFLVGVPSLCHEEIGAQTGSRDYICFLILFLYLAKVYHREKDNF
jgi:hypothetical protein